MQCKPHVRKYGVNDTLLSPVFSPLIQATFSMLKLTPTSQKYFEIAAFALNVCAKVKTREMPINILLGTDNRQ